MALPTKPDMTHVWASGGAKVAPGNTKIDTGWTAEVPPFQWENWSQNRQDAFLAHINVSGFPVWDGLTNYEAAGQSLTKGSDGIIYKSVAASGPSTTVQDPVTDVSDTYWTVAFASVGAFLTQVAGDTRYTQRSNNLSDLSNIPTARTNLGLDNTFKAGIAGTFSNLKASATGTNSSVTVTADAICLKNTSNEQVVLNTLSVTPSLTASGANGLDSGVSAASTWYSVWVIWNGTTAAGLLSLSATAPTMPSGYTHKARVGWIRTDSTANKYPLSFVQFAHRVQYKISTGSNVQNYPVMASGINGSLIAPTWVAVSVSPFAPPTATGVSVAASIPPNSSSSLAVNPNNAVGAMNSAANRPVLLATNTTTTSTYGSTASASILLESSNIYVAMDSASQSVLCVGWEDNL